MGSPGIRRNRRSSETRRNRFWTRHFSLLGETRMCGWITPPCLPRIAPAPLKWSRPWGYFGIRMRTIAVMLKSWQRLFRYVKGAPNSEFTHIDAGISVFERSALQEIPLHQNVALDQFFSSWAATGRLGAFLVRQRFYETGSWAGSSDFEKFIADGGDSAS